ncbi:hypothetical protein E3N88_01448 [Mikania micrantha]|uniref:Uncharacterized protein n=1 Tax=Mikania micrantha TaxID=192012 RepID=A0A5N6Q183_9ASTR|nr:hypothetical protein E3N88_01448 [Mikania micrantha]
MNTNHKERVTIAVENYVIDDMSTYGRSRNPHQENELPDGRERTEDQRKKNSGNSLCRVLETAGGGGDSILDDQRQLGRRLEAGIQDWREPPKKDRDFCLSEVDLSEFCATIADAPFSTSMLESNIRDPLLRYIHRVLACIVVGRSSGEEKVNWIDLFCLYCMVTGREANVACVLATSLARARRGGGRARLDMGPYIYRMAEYLGVFDRYRPDLMILGPLTTPIDLRDLQRAGIVERDNPPRWAEFMVGPQVMPPQGTPAADAVMGSVPTHRQRPVFRRDFPPR